jgi:hypothetical protein
LELNDVIENQYLYELKVKNSDSISRYIGVTDNPVRREHEHLVKFARSKYYQKYHLYKWIRSHQIKGDIVIMSIIEGPYTEKFAYNREIELIKEYKDLGFKMVNGTEGGKKPPKCTGEILEKVLKTRKEKNHLYKWLKSEDWTEERRINHKEACKNRPYKEPWNKGTGKRKQKDPLKKSFPKTVYQYSKDGILIAEYPSTYCLKQYGFDSSAISKVCRGVREFAYGYKWSYNLLKT